MSILKNFSYMSLTGLMVLGAGLVSPPPVHATDVEVFFSDPLPNTAKPNVLFIIDTSQSMFTPEASPAATFDPSKEYDGPCDKEKYYWTNLGDSPSCGTPGWVGLDDSQFQCANWKASVDINGALTKSTRVAQRTGGWNNLTAFPAQQAVDTTCQGDTTEATINWTKKTAGKDVYPTQSVTFYTGNYLNWAGTSSGVKLRIDIMREAVSRLVSNTAGVKFGLMRYGFDGNRNHDLNTPTQCRVEQDPVEDGLSGNGAPVVYPVTDPDKPALAGYKGATVREQIRYLLGTNTVNQNLGWIVNPSTLDASQPYQIVKGGGSNCPIPLFTPGGRSPIGGAMHEAYRYYTGQKWTLKYGKQAQLGSTYKFSSHPASLRADGETYVSPIEDSCAKNFIVLLSDGTTQQDNDVDPLIEGLPGFSATVGSAKCDDEAFLDGTPPPSKCVDDLAEYMFETDLSTIPGFNNIITHTVGFRLGADDEANSARALLDETATRGGGYFYEAGSVQQLEEALAKIMRSVLTENTTFSAPAVTVNAFNRTQNLNDLYMSVFRPSDEQRWLGNIKKYRIDPTDGDIIDSEGRPAVDPATGYFQSGTRSFWSDSSDGSDITAGGAASKIDYTTRKVLTNASGTTLTNLTAAGYTNADLGIVAGDHVKWSNAATPLLTATDLVNWVYGRDVMDIDNDGVTAESRFDMGDPLHSKPVTLIYGGTAADPDLDDSVLFVTTNDGLLQAIDPILGTELWSFLPKDLAPKTRNQYYNRALADVITQRSYGLDGHLSLLRIDSNGNGIIEPDAPNNDRVYLFFGQRRGGTMYYGMDVTNKTSPTLMWARSYATAGSGQSWSALVPARVLTGGTVRRVLFFGGGYDSLQDQQAYVEDTKGRGIYMIDALTGNLLWRAGPDAGANLQLPEMRHSIPSDLRVVDISGDGFADRIYASDLGGRVWRFDLMNGKTIAGTEGNRFVEGGMFASLGNVEDSAPRDESNTLRFFYGPDPALITLSGPPFINLAIGSGHRERPLLDSSRYAVTPVKNWLFSMRDYNVLTAIKSSQYKADCTGATEPCHRIIREGDLEDLSNVVGDAAAEKVPLQLGVMGWKIALADDGEKALAEARTFKNAIYITTYAPSEKGRTPDNCSVVFGKNRVYVVNVADATPVNNFNKENPVGEVDDRSKELAQGSIAPEVVFIFPTPGVDPSDPTKELPAVSPVCLVGLEGCGEGMSNPPVRTYWRKKGVR
jgi:type IV pilus assembly protein PilY1